MQKIISSASRTACLMALTLAMISPASAEEKERAFRVESQLETPGTRPGSLEVTYTLVNTSPKRITAWDFGCLDILHDGTDGGLTMTSVDAYRVLEMKNEGREVSMEGRDGIVEPNQRVERKVTFDPADQAGPYAAKSCGPIVAIFEDATFEGAQHLADAHFARRAQEAIEAKRNVRDLEKLIERGKPLAAALDFLAVRPAGKNLDGMRQAIHRGYPATAKMVFEELDGDYRWAVRHLPPYWQARVAKELGILDSV